MTGMALFVDDSALAGMWMFPPAGLASEPSCSPCGVDIVVDICSGVDSAILIWGGFASASFTSMGLSIEIRSDS